MMGEDQALLRRLTRAGARIVPADFGGSVPAYPKGDRRKRALFWVPRAQFLKLQELGLLTDESGLGFGAVTENIDGYVPPKKCRAKTILEQLKTSKSGQVPFLARSEVQAAERFLRDHARAHQGEAASQNFAGAGVFVQKSAAGQEARMADRVDAQGRLRQARASLDKPLQDMLCAVLIADTPLAQIERDQGWARESARPVFKRALTELSAHYESLEQI